MDPVAESSDREKDEPCEQEGSRSQFQAPILGSPFFVPVIYDPKLGLPVIPLYPAPGVQATSSDQASEQQGGLFVVPAYSAEPIPFSYNAPLNGAEREAVSPEAEEARRARAEERQLRRFRVGIQLDLLLIIKLVTMVFIFSQDGSRDKLLLLVLAGIVYLYQTGSLAPLLRWASERARRAMMPQVQPANVPRVPDVQHPGAAANGEYAADSNAQGNIPQDAAAGEQQNAQVEGQQQLQQQQVQALGNWQGFVREVQMFVVGLITSLLPGFHNID